MPYNIAITYRKRNANERTHQTPKLKSDTKRKSIECSTGEKNNEGKAKNKFNRRAENEVRFWKLCIISLNMRTGNANFTSTMQTNMNYGQQQWRYNCS